MSRRTSSGPAAGSTGHNSLTIILEGGLKKRSLFGGESLDVSQRRSTLMGRDAVTMHMVLPCGWPVEAYEVA